MANGIIGTHPSHGYQVVETITEAKQLDRNDSGKYFMVDNTTAFTMNLPKLSTEIAGWNCKFIVQVNGGNDVHIMAHGLTSAGGTTGDANSVLLKEIPGGDGEDGGLAAAQDGVVIKADSLVQDSLECFTDGTSWFFTAFAEEVNHFDDVG
tara:strand:- start:429 stop:881 length:453 start_codon:yes stop_codon:yes gene_type:complete